MKKEIIYRGIPCDSEAEKFCLMYLFELQDNGYIKNLDRSASYDLAPPIKRIYSNKGSKSVKEETLMREVAYSPDFSFWVTDKGRVHGSLFRDIECDCSLKERKFNGMIHQDGMVHVEVKGTTFRTKDSTIEKFKVVSKWLWEKHGIYVNLFTHSDVFAKTFTPQEYLLTEKLKKERKLKWSPISLSEFLI